MNYYLPNETELINDFHQSDLRADRLLFNRHFKSLCVYADNIVGNMQEAEDLVVVVFHKMMTVRLSFPSTSNISAFLYRATRNAALNAIRNNKQRSIARQQFSYFEPSTSLQKDAYQHEIVQVELLSHIYHEVEALPKQCRTIFKLYFLKQWSTDRIAGLLGISPQTARTQKARAIQLLKIKILKKVRHCIHFLFLSFLLQ